MRNNIFKISKKLSVLIAFFLISINAKSQNDSSAIQGLIDRIVSLDEEIRNNPALQVDNFNPNDSASLPIGIVKEIGNTIYAICIDSARFTPQGAFFSVYMALDFPGADRKIAFAAKNVQFNPQGVIVSNGARLQLVNQQVVNLGPKMQMVFKDDGKNFIEWDCNGYKQTGLSIDFVLNGDLLVNALDPNLPVKAEMEMIIEDLNNLSFVLDDMDPFKVKGAEDFTFALSNIVIDRSEFSTPSGVVLSPQALAMYNGDINSWKGFYAQNVLITLPEKMNKNDQPMQLYANDMLIDDAGLSGSFGGNNLFSTTEGSMEGKWGFSVDNLQVDIVCNHFTSGTMTGDVSVPPLDDKIFNYNASISENPNSDKLDYSFVVSPENGPITINALKSKITLAPSSQLVVESVNGKFIPTATLTGDWTVDFSKAKISGIAFQDLTITSQSPYITSGIFSLVSNQSQSQCTKFPISVSNFGMGLTPQNQLTVFGDIGLNIGGDNVNFGVNTSVQVITKLENNAQGQLRLKYDRFAISDIAIDCQTSAFHLLGLISIRNDDPIFGDLFYGSISLMIDDVLDGPIMVSAGFGKMPTYKYWFTDASLPITIPVMAGLNITSLYGGVQNRVSSTLTTTELLDRVAGQISLNPNANTGSAIPFVPDANMGLTFRAGVGLAATSEKVFNGDVVLSVAFNANGGFQSIEFAGRAFMMVKRDERQNTNGSKVWGQVLVSYDNSTKVLDADISASMVVPSVLTGGLNIKFHIDQNDWYFWLNRPSNRAYVNLLGLFTAQTYFMIGTQIEAIPPPPSYVANIVGYTGGGIDLAAVGNGSGFCTGLDISASFGGEFPKTTKWRGYVGVNVGIGFDVMVFNAQNAKCAGSNDPIGVNGYYAIGQIYAYLGGSFGARKYKDDGSLKKEYPLGSLQMAALLQGKLPKPSYVYGAVGIQCEILGIINFTFNADIEFGDNCTIVGI